MKNIIVESSCSITGCSSAGGLVGYIGGAGKGNNGLVRNLVGEILIENCEIYADVTSTNTKTHTNYNPVGGIIGFTTRNGFKQKGSGETKNYALNSEGQLITDTEGDSAPLSITIKDCTYAGKLTGNNAIGVVFGDVLTLPDTITTITIDGGSFEGATFASTVDSDRVAALAATTQSADLKQIVIKDLETEKIVSSYPALVRTCYDKGTHKNEKYNLSKEIIN